MNEYAWIQAHHVHRHVMCTHTDIHRVDPILLLPFSVYFHHLVSRESHDLSSLQLLPVKVEAVEVELTFELNDELSHCTSHKLQ